MYQKIEGEHWRHVWVVSDIHGCYQWLIDELKRRHFNPDTDLLISVGDIIDRGPDSVKMFTADAGKLVLCGTR